MVGEMLLLLAGAVSVFMFGMALEDTLSKRKERKPSLVVVALSNGGTVHEAEAMLRDTAANVQDKYKPRDPDYYVQGWIFKGRGYVMTTRIAIAKAPARFRAAADLCRELEEQFNEHIEKANQRGDLERPPPLGGGEGGTGGAGTGFEGGDCVRGKEGENECPLVALVAGRVPEGASVDDGRSGGVMTPIGPRQEESCAPAGIRLSEVQKAAIEQLRQAGITGFRLPSNAQELSERDRSNLENALCRAVERCVQRRSSTPLPTQEKG